MGPGALMRVGHAIVSPRRPLAALAGRLDACAWDMAELALGLSVPRARRDHLGSRWTRAGADVMLAYLRRVLPRRVALGVTGVITNEPDLFERAPR